MSVRGRNIDLRISTLPSQYGESVVFRILDSSRIELTWDALGFSKARQKQLDHILDMPNGIFLVAGPTGSGKSTTLYTALTKLKSRELKIITVEDPIEQSIEGINQVQIEPEIDLSFPNALRAILRQDPDIIMIGEIRDAETAEIAVRAALVGRLVLSTVHTNDSISAITRLRDLGVPSYLIASTLRGVLSQRLVGRICRNCKGVGCKECASKSSLGRVAVSELLEVNKDISDEIAKDGAEKSVKTLAQKNGYAEMSKEAQSMVKAGTIAKQEIAKL